MSDEWEASMVNFLIMKQKTRASALRAMALLSAAELLGMSVWFSASAVVPALQSELHLSNSTSSWLTLAVQIGFVAGTLLSAVFNLPDVMEARYLFAICATAAGLTNVAFAEYVQGSTTAIALRFFTGFFLAGVYPPGMKIMATWFRRSRGTAIGVLIGALTLGKASPYLVNSLGTENWRTNVLVVSFLPLFAALLVALFVRKGPYSLPAAKFDITQVTKVFGNRGVRLANFGYFGHMWELYAMWTWIPVMIRASFAASGDSMKLAELSSFIVIGSGAAGCIIAGIMADRYGRTLVASAAMIMSGACCLVIGFFFQQDPLLLLILAAIWGASVVADSAQFSTCVTELGDPQYIGTALTLQTCVGFLLTTISIHLIPSFVAAVGWRYAFVILAPGPAFGVLSMLRLRGLPEAAKIAQGKR